MNTRRMQSLAVMVASLLVLAGLTGCPLLLGHEYVDDSHTETRDFAPGDQLNVAGVIGDISITTWEEDAVAITYQKHITVFSPWFTEPDANTYFDQMAVEIETGDNTGSLTVRDVMPVSFEQLYSPSITLDIKMPSYAVLNVVQNVGNVTITGVHGAIDAKLNAGDLIIHHPVPAADDSITTKIVQVGDTELYFPESSAFDVDAVTNFGQITANDFWSIVIDDTVAGAHATGTVNGGGASVALDTNIGDIDFLWEQN